MKSVKSRRNVSKISQSKKKVMSCLKKKSQKGGTPNEGLGNFNLIEKLDNTSQEIEAVLLIGDQNESKTIKFVVEYPKDSSGKPKLFLGIKDESNFEYLQITEYEIDGEKVKFTCKDRDSQTIEISIDKQKLEDGELKFPETTQASVPEVAQPSPPEALAAATATDQAPYQRSERLKEMLRKSYQDAPGSDGKEKTTIPSFIFDSAAFGEKRQQLGTVEDGDKRREAAAAAAKPAAPKVAQPSSSPRPSSAPKAAPKAQQSLLLQIQEGREILEKAAAAKAAKAAKAAAAATTGEGEHVKDAETAAKPAESPSKEPPSFAEQMAEAMGKRREQIAGIPRREATTPAATTAGEGGRGDASEEESDSEGEWDGGSLKNRSRVFKKKSQRKALTFSKKKKRVSKSKSVHKKL